MKKNNYHQLSRQWFFLLLIPLLLFSCRKEMKVEQTNDNAIFPTTTAQKETVFVLKEVSDILKKVYLKPKAYYEVNATIYAGYYEDERVLLKDLLFPEFSALYKTEKFKKFKATPGEFKKAFTDIFSKGDYPNLEKAMGVSRNVRTTAAISTDTAMQIYSNSNGVSIYFPYSENFTVPLTTAYFDNINTDPWGHLATVIPADREADTAPGDKPYRFEQYDANGESLGWYIQYKPVMVSDAYVEMNPTHIAGVGAEPARQVAQDPPPPPPGTPINRVYHGWSVLFNQLDRLISFSGNGGGSEIRICRISGYLKFENQQVTNFAGDVISAYYTRKAINKKRWERIYGVWDPDWKMDNTEQVYAVYEDDTEGTATFSGALNTTLTSGTTTVSGNIGFSVTVKTKDELITQRKQDRYSYFRDAKNDQGWGFEICDGGRTVTGCGRYDGTFLPAGQYWPVYDKGTIFGFTWPYKTY